MTIVRQTGRLNRSRPWLRICGDFANFYNALAKILAAEGVQVSMLGLSSVLGPPQPACRPDVVDFVGFVASRKSSRWLES